MNLSEATKHFPPIWTIYDSPADYPGEIIVRTWYGDVPGNILCRCETVKEAEQEILKQGGCFYLGRAEGDDKVIVGSWI